MLAFSVAMIPMTDTTKGLMMMSWEKNNINLVYAYLNINSIQNMFERNFVI